MNGWVLVHSKTLKVERYEFLEDAKKALKDLIDDWKCTYYMKEGNDLEAYSIRRDVECPPYIMSEKEYLELCED